MRPAVAVVGLGRVRVCPAVVWLTSNVVATSTVAAAVPMFPPVARLAMLSPVLRVLPAFTKWSPLLTVNVPLTVRPAKVGVEDVAMPWAVSITPELAVKSVALKAAIPLVEPSAAAFWIVMVLPAPVASAMARAPLKPFRLDTPPLPPEDPDRQLPKENTPEPLVSRHWPLEPSAVGRVKVRLPPVAPAWSVRVLLLVELLNVMEPVLLEAVPRDRLLEPKIASVPLSETVVPDSLRLAELATELLPLKTEKSPLVPEPVMPPPLAQLPHEGARPTPPLIRQEPVATSLSLDKPEVLEAKSKSPVV